MFKRILIATDFSEPSVAAREAAISLARKCTGHVQAIHVVSYLQQPYPYPDTFFPELEDLARVELEKFLSPEEYPDSGREVLVGISIADRILEYARNEKYDLIVVGNGGRSAISRALLGSVTQEIIRISEIPVLVVKGWKDSAKRYQAFGRVLCPVDFSEASVKCFELAIQFANLLKADLDLIHVIDPDSLKTVREDYSIPVPDTCELNVDLTLRKLAENKKLVGQLRVATLVGEPDQEILKYAEKNQISFVLMASHRKGTLERVLLGSVTASCVSHGGIPVLTFAPLS